MEDLKKTSDIIQNIYDDEIEKSDVWVIVGFVNCEPSPLYVPKDAVAVALPLRSPTGISTRGLLAAAARGRPTRAAWSDAATASWTATKSHGIVLCGILVLVLQITFCILTWFSSGDSGGKGGEPRRILTTLQYHALYCLVMAKL